MDTQWAVDPREGPGSKGPFWGPSEIVLELIHGFWNGKRRRRRRRRKKEEEDARVMLERCKARVALC